MADGPTTDDIVQNNDSRLTPSLRLLLQLLKRYTLYIGLLLGLPFVLFLVLASVSLFQWWHFPWSEPATVWLFRAMTLGAAVNALIYSTASFLFFVSWLHHKLSVPVQKRPRMAVTYTFAPLIYCLVMAWGITFLRGHSEGLLAYAALVAFILMVLISTRLRFSEQRKPVPSAAS